MPISLGLLLLLIGLIYLFLEKKGKAKLFITSSLIWLFLISYAPFANRVMQPLETTYPALMKIDKDVKYVMVLGSGHITNKNLPATSQLSLIGLARLSEGIRIFKTLDNATLITSGSSSRYDATPHALMSRKAAIELGVNEANIVSFYDTRDTQEEALKLKDLIGGSKFILVTSSSHMPRAVKIFKSVGLNPIPAPADFISRDNSLYVSGPNAKEVMKTQRALHEYIGSLWHDIKENLNSYLD